MQIRNFIDQNWFEMRDIRPRRLDASVWIPLRAISTIEKCGRYGFVGFKKELLGVGTLAVPIDKKNIAEKLDWGDVGISHEHGPNIGDEVYIASDIYQDCKGEFTVIHLVLEQNINSLEGRECHLHQDLVIALGMKREGDIWISPSEGYIEVARLRKDQDSSPCLLEIHAEHLKDYLCARKMALYVTSYRSREVVVDDTSHISWSQNPIREIDDKNRWEGWVNEIHEGGHAFGAKTAVFHTSRTDIDVEEDVPRFGLPHDDNLTSRSWTIEQPGRKLYHIQGELWRNEWIEPATLSPRIRGDKVLSTAFFLTKSVSKKPN
jgi:hypothetical protein